MKTPMPKCDFNKVAKGHLDISASTFEYKDCLLHSVNRL